MSKKLIDLIGVGFEKGQEKICFTNFTSTIYSGKRIVIMGPNGAGKSTLLKIIQGIIEPSSGKVNILPGVSFGYVPQTINEYQKLSGGQRFNKSLSQAISIDPEVLCLDEPTNHLDEKNKKSLIKMLENYHGTLFVVSHDLDILKLYFDEIWDVENGEIKIFSGGYQEYLKEREDKLSALEKEREVLLREKRVLVNKVEKERKRVSKSRSANKDENDKCLLGGMKQRGSATEGKNSGRLSKKRDEISKKLSEAILPEKIKPKFNLDAQKLSSQKAIISVIDGSCGYEGTIEKLDAKEGVNFAPILRDINFQLGAKERVAIFGDNGSGKSTLIKALMSDPDVIISGQWIKPKQDAIGYLDQHYSNLYYGLELGQELTVKQVIHAAAPEMDDAQVRRHLNDFLFRKPIEIENKVLNLSGGQKARLSLAVIAAKNPYLLLLDEITNNIDMIAREHIVEVLNQYPGAMIIVSHDKDFLERLNISTCYEIYDGMLAIKF